MTAAAPSLLLLCAPPALGHHPTGRRGRSGRGLAAAALVIIMGATAPAEGAPPEPPPPAAASPPARRPPAGLGEKPDREQPQIERAMALHDEARELYQRGAYRAAIARLEEALALDPEGKELVYNLAVIHEKLGEIERAEAYFRRYLEMEHDAKARKEVEAVLRRLEGAKNELAKSAPERAPPAPRTAPPPTAPAPEPSSSRPIRPWVVGAGSVAAGALLIGNIFALSALIRDPGSDAKTGAGVSADQLAADAKAAHRDAIIADVALLIAGISGGLAIYYYLSTPPLQRQAPATAPSKAVPPRPFSRAAVRGIGLSVSGAGTRLWVQF